MKKVVLLVITICMTIFTFSCTNKDSVSKETKVEGDFFKSGSDDSNYVELQRVKDNIWVHTTYKDYNGVRTPSNGVIAVTSKGLVLIDTPWNNAQTRELIRLAKKVFNKDISLAVITHAHEDRIGGIDALIEKKVDVRSSAMTFKEAEKYGYKKPQAELDLEKRISWGDTDIDVFYPGEGHTVDNITVWFPQYKVLFGGCLIKSLESKDVGNTEDANVKQWPFSLKNVLDMYSDAEIVIPGHGKWGGMELVEHTLDLLQNK
jgi:metallo-beta-lactamase class B